MGGWDDKSPAASTRRIARAKSFILKRKGAEGRERDGESAEKKGRATKEGNETTQKRKIREKILKILK